MRHHSGRDVIMAVRDVTIPNTMTDTTDPNTTGGILDISSCTTAQMQYSNKEHFKLWKMGAYYVIYSVKRNCPLN